MGLLLASTFTLGLLSTFVASILLSLLYFTGTINAYWLLGLTLLINLLMWLVGPFISDLVYRFFYDLDWITLDELRDVDPEIAAFLEETCADHGYDVPKLGLIDDQNPNAFTYGSGRWNARLVVTTGLFEYLDTNELKAVYGHELGHITHRDFIVMTVANTLVQLLYELFIITRHAASSDSGGRNKGKAPLIGVMVAAYIFYWVGRYALLYLSRVREYYADQYAAQRTNPNHLSSALIKVSYGILANDSDTRLVKSTKHLGVQDIEIAENLGLAYYNCESLQDFKPHRKVLLYDLVNPWAKISELHSTHPLTAKRIRRLSRFTRDPLFDFDRIRQGIDIDHGRLRANFLKDVSALALPAVLTLGFPLAYLAAVWQGLLPLNPFHGFGGWLAAFGIGLTGRTLYKYPTGQPREATVLDLMADIYASPVRGQPVKLQGELAGKGIPGYIFSEDMLLRDDTGLIYLNYESWLPVIGNLLFSIGKVDELLDQPAQIDGWYLRGTRARLGLKHLHTDQEDIRGFVRLGSIIGAALLTLIGAGIALYPMLAV